MITIQNVTITPSVVETQELFVISVQVTSVLTWADMLSTTWGAIKAFTWAKLKGGN